MDPLIFKTNIKDSKKLKQLKPLFNTHCNIVHWSIDLEDIDKVLRIVPNNSLKETEVISLIENEGFYCEVLTD
ncbi:hypothetical protein [Pontimicrobium sp. IMCC45349]|uniref:hypothetical protein n=1 Tax=Pontimicrobium sp. IMCC45349 TaxID=3391574 RepID=UPI00399F876E